MKDEYTSILEVTLFQAAPNTIGIACACDEMVCPSLMQVD
jgi:hypothetical protein